MWQNFILETLLPNTLNYFNERNQVGNRNRERLRQHARNEAKYRNDFNRDVLLWHNESQDREIEVDNKWQEVLSKIASDDLKLWSAVSKAGLTTQQAYATMMSVGATEQTGARSSTTTNRRKAVLSYAATIAEVSNKLSLSRDNAALNRSTWGNEFNRFSQQSFVKTMTGRPMPGTPPPSIPLENKPDFLTGFLLPLVGGYVNHRNDAQALSPPFTDDQMRPKTSASPASSASPISPVLSEVSPQGEMLPDVDSFTDQGQIGDFFRKRNRNVASSRLGSSFQLSSV